MKIKLIFSIFCLSLAYICLAQKPNSIVGFSQNQSKEEEKREKIFDENLSSQRIGETIKLLSALPHHVGSVGGKKVAETIKNKFIEYGWNAEIKTYQVLFPTPILRSLEMLAPKKFVASLKEPGLKEDATSGQEGQLPTYNCWSADGDVTAGLIFVNYGLPSDYEILEKYGISVKGKIVIAKYGKSWRGIKPKIAQEHGAIGCIIYSDPADDGYAAGDVYPKGPFKNEYGVQRGSIMDMVIYPGDPLTPNVAATAEQTRIKKEEAINLLKIPVLPISYADAKPLLENLSGPTVPRDWVGNLPITYHFGDGKTEVHLKVKFDWQMKEANNVIAQLKGREFPDQWIIRGNHHDAWVNGADDPISSMAVELDEAYALGQLVKQGWQPKRTIVYCAWDAEEPGLLGSTEWVEDLAQTLQKKAVVYINSDGNGRGFVSVGGSQALGNMITEILKSVTDPQTNISVFDRQKLYKLQKSNSFKEAQKIYHENQYKIYAVGSGSDYSPFIQHLGIPALNIGFGGEDAGGEYHSIYDSYDLYARFKDINFMYGPALAKVIGRSVLRMSEAEVLPFNYKITCQTIKSYMNELIELLETLRNDSKLENLKTETQSALYASDPLLKLQFNQTKLNEVPYLDFSSMQNSIQNLEIALDSLNTKIETLTDEQKQKLNIKLFTAEQKLLSANGLPRRTWYKHTIYAPGFYTGYGVKTLPGIREALEQKNWTEAQEQINIVTTSLNNLYTFIKE